MYVDKTVSEIVAERLEAGGVPHRMALSCDYPKVEHVCQYRESDLAFVSRLLERDGIYFYFEHGDDEIHCATSEKHQ